MEDQNTQNPVTEPQNVPATEEQAVPAQPEAPVSEPAAPVEGQQA